MIVRFAPRAPPNGVLMNETPISERYRGAAPGHAREPREHAADPNSRY
jgi:hypothetical protein